MSGKRGRPPKKKKSGPSSDSPSRDGDFFDLDEYGRHSEMDEEMEGGSLRRSLTDSQDNMLTSSGSLKIKIKLGPTPTLISSTTGTSPTKEGSISLTSSSSGIPVAGYQSQAFQAALGNSEGPLVLLNYPKFDLPLHFPQQLLARSAAVAASAGGTSSTSSSPTPPVTLGPREMVCLREELEALRDAMREFKDTMKSELKKASNLKIDSGISMIIEEAPKPRKRGPKPNMSKLAASTGSLNTSSSSIPTIASQSSSSSTSIPINLKSSSNKIPNFTGLSAADLTALEGKRGRRKGPSGEDSDSKSSRRSNKDKKYVIKFKRGNLDPGSEEDEINVDVVDDEDSGDSGRMGLDYEDEEDEDFERGGKKGGYGTNTRKRNSSSSSSGIGGQVTAPSPPKKKQNNNILPPPITSASGRPLRSREKNQKKRKRIGDDYSDDEITKLPVAPNTFWGSLEPYITPITHDHLNLLNPVVDDARDEVYSIPPLGRHYVDSWASETSKDSKTRHSSRLVREAHHHRLVVDDDDDVFVEEDGISAASSSSRPSSHHHHSSSHHRHSSDRERDRDRDRERERERERERDRNTNPAVGDLTQRLLSAFVEAKVLTTDGKKMSTANGSDYDWPLSAPPTSDYSEHAILNLEERIRIELKSIGLLDDEDIDLNVNREDDEICAELRTLQGQLTAQRQVNNIQRHQLQVMAVAKIKEQEVLRRRREEWHELEQAYYKMMKSKKRPHKKRRPENA